MKSRFQRVLQQFNFLCPTYAGQCDIMVNYITDNNIVLDAYRPYHNSATFMSKHVHLKPYAYQDSYTESGFTDSILCDFYKTIDINATTVNLDTLHISNLDEINVSVIKLRRQLINIIIESKCELNYMIVSPTMLKYVLNIAEFDNNIQHFLVDDIHRRLSRVGTIFNNVAVYLDYYEDDFIVIGTTIGDPLKLFYSWNNIANNRIHYSLEVVCHNFSDNFYIIKNLRKNDPMETNITSVTTEQFFTV